MYYQGDAVIPKLSKNAIQVLEKKYLRGETPTEMFRRVANHIAKAEVAYDCPVDEIKERVSSMANIFFNMMASLDFLPNSPTLMNAGRPLGQLAACFVVPVGDSMEDIFQAIKEMAMVQKTGGGTGFDFSSLIPKDDPVTSTAGESSGPISFMKAFDSCTDVVKQGGVRRGANMGILRVDHPDILDFIEAKSDLTQLTNFNVSVAITDEFMYCLREHKPFTLKFNGTDYAEIDPSVIWAKIIDRAWNTGEPGIIFIDEINANNPTPHVGAIAATNPCGEQPLLPFEACNLGSINLAHMSMGVSLSDSTINRENMGTYIDQNKLSRLVHYAVRFLDDVIDMNLYPLPQIAKTTKSNRKIGLGIMGWADLLFQLRIPYDSDLALSLAEYLMAFIQEEAHKASNILGMQRGTFPNYNNSKWDKARKIRRNATCTTIAPTGNLSIIAGVSSGIEPIFALSYVKNLTDAGKLIMINSEVKCYIQEEAVFGEYTDEEILSIINTHRNHEKHGFPLLSSIFKTSHEITPDWHVKMQAAFQKHIDNAVSKTINFSSETTRKQISDAIQLAWDLKCKGLTVYRDGSRDTQPMTIETKKAVLPKFQRPEIVEGFTAKARTGCGNMFVTVNHVDGEVKEVFLKTGNSGGCTAFTEALGRIISVGLKYGTPIEEIIDQARSVRCDNFRNQCGKDKTLKGKSCPDVVGNIIQDFIKNKTVQNLTSIEETAQITDEQWYAMEHNWGKKENKSACPECGAPLERSEGCIKCQCGFARC
jgi:ribonucleoside-diphosphate reductase alpha chain